MTFSGDPSLSVVRAYSESEKDAHKTASKLAFVRVNEMLDAIKANPGGTPVRPEDLGMEMLLCSHLFLQDAFAPALVADLFEGIAGQLRKTKVH
jgi:hypothetical protein